MPRLTSVLILEVRLDNVADYLSSALSNMLSETWQIQSYELGNVNPRIIKEFNVYVFL